MDKVAADQSADILFAVRALFYRVGVKTQLKFDNYNAYFQLDQLPDTGVGIYTYNINATLPTL